MKITITSTIMKCHLDETVFGRKCHLDETVFGRKCHLDETVFGRKCLNETVLGESELG